MLTSLWCSNFGTQFSAFLPIFYICKTRNICSFYLSLNNLNNITQKEHLEIDFWKETRINTTRAPCIFLKMKDISEIELVHRLSWNNYCYTGSLSFLQRMDSPFKYWNCIDMSNGIQYLPGCPHKKENEMMLFNAISFKTFNLQN